MTQTSFHTGGGSSGGSTAGSSAASGAGSEAGSSIASGAGSEAGSSIGSSAASGMPAAAFSVPTRAEVSAHNQAIFDNLQKNLGFVPNLYAYFAKNETALRDYLAFQNRKTTLSGKEREIVNLVTSQINGCRYCQSAHTVVGKMVDFTDEQIIEIRKGTASFDDKLNALAVFTASVVQNRGRATENSKTAFFDAGYNEANMIDVVIAVGDKIISNYIHNLTGLEIDFPLAEQL